MEISQTTPLEMEQNQAPPIDPVAGKSVAEVFGEIVWLMTQDKEARELTISKLEELVMPAIMLRQFHIQYAPLTETQSQLGEQTARQALIPMQVEIFAMCSEKVAEKIVEGDYHVPQINEWRSGPERKIVATFRREAK